MNKHLFSFVFAALILAMVAFAACEKDNTDNLKLTPASDCPNLPGNIGDSCQIISNVNPNLVIQGVIDTSCQCEPVGINYSCPQLQLNIGDPCYPTPNQQGIVDTNCNCVPNTANYDCPQLQLNVGDSCLTQNGGWGVIGVNCNCQ